MRRQLLIIFTGLLLLPLASAQTADEAREALSEVERTIKKMNQSDIPTKRVSDLYRQANSSYQTQLERNSTGKETDYSGVLNTADQIQSIRTEAFRAKDQLALLRSRIDELDQDEDLNLSDAKEELERAETEFQDERFERSQNHIDQAYQEISEAQSAVTQAQAFAAATRDRFRMFLADNWKPLSTATILLALLSYLGHKEYRIWRLKRDKHGLKQKREVLHSLIADAQHDYFQQNEMAQSTYNTRTDKYGELIRDINRQLPLINEELEKRWSPSQLIKQKIHGNK